MISKSKKKVKINFTQKHFLQKHKQNNTEIRFVYFLIAGRVFLWLWLFPDSRLVCLAVIKKNYSKLYLESGLKSQKIS